MKLNEMNVNEIRKIAQQNKMPGAWKAKKAEMIEFLSHVDEVEPESIEEPKVNDLSVEDESVPEPTQELLKLKPYGAWVVDRVTKEITTVVGEATSREEFYQSIKGQYRVRLITKPEKLEEECKQWEIRHARNKKIKNEKYAADKEKASELNMKVSEYRKWVREHE